MNITLDEIRSKAPKGATHYIDCNGFTYHKMSGSFWMSWNESFKCWDFMHLTWCHKLKPL